VTESPESAQLADAQSRDKAVVSKLREGYETHLREGRSLFGVE
jgi:hypothetical protein